MKRIRWRSFGLLLLMHNYRWAMMRCREATGGATTMASIGTSERREEKRRGRRVLWSCVEKREGRQRDREIERDWEVRRVAAAQRERIKKFD